jgi:hypothetical protein
MFKARYPYADIVLYSVVKTSAHPTHIVLMRVGECDSYKHCFCCVQRLVYTHKELYFMFLIIYLYFYSFLYVFDDAYF